MISGFSSFSQQQPHLSHNTLIPTNHVARYATYRAQVRYIPTNHVPLHTHPQLWDWVILELKYDAFSWGDPRVTALAGVSQEDGETARKVVARETAAYARALTAAFEKVCGLGEGWRGGEGGEVAAREAAAYVTCSPPR